jgi:S-adenosylmethionine-diacylglycerol 3-amino-3-carboxypropyl transferase
MTRIDSRARFDLIRYANSWEDADVLCDALRPALGKRMLAIASGGDNAFALLAEGAEVVAVDLSDAQLALVELKRAAIRERSNDDVLAFLGIRGSIDRMKVFDALTLPDDVRAYWQANANAISGGVAHAGRFENYFAMFRRYVLPLVHSRKDTLALLAEKSEKERREFYDRRWNTIRWRMMFRIFFSRFVMGRAGRDPEFFRYVEGSVAERIMRRAEYAMTVLPTHANPYLAFIFTGNYTTILPRYLRKLDEVRANLDRLTLVRGSIDETTRGTFDGFYLSDIFEYVDESTFKTMRERIVSMSNHGARLAYWNLLVPRRGEHELRDEQARLFARDLAFFYSAFILEEVGGQATLPVGGQAGLPDLQVLR